MDFLNDGDGRKISVEKWIEHWSRCFEQVYDDFDEYFENMNFSTGSLDNQNLAALCKWSATLTRGGPMNGVRTLWTQVSGINQ
jgi:hypothetical protein